MDGFPGGIDSAARPRDMAQSGRQKRPSQNMKQYLELMSERGIGMERDVKINVNQVRSRNAGIRRVGNPYDEAPQTYTAPNAPTMPDFVAPQPSLLLDRPPCESHYDGQEASHLREDSQPINGFEGYHGIQGPPASLLFNSARVAGLRFYSALDAQVTHLLVPCWRPSSGSYGAPNSDQERIPYVIRLFNAFNTTGAVYDEESDASHFQPGGLWHQHPDDIEAICWSMVESTLSLHLVGTVGLRFRRFPQTLPKPNSPDANLTFQQRISCLTLLVTHYKSFATRMLLREEVEESLVFAYDILFRKYKFGQRLSKMSAQQQALVQLEFDIGQIPQGTSVAPVRQDSMAAGLRNHNSMTKRSLSPSSQLAQQSSPKRPNTVPSPDAAEIVESFVDDLTAAWHDPTSFSDAQGQSGSPHPVLAAPSDQISPEAASTTHLSDAGPPAFSGYSSSVMLRGSPDRITTTNNADAAPMADNSVSISQGGETMHSFNFADWVDDGGEDHETNC